MVKVYYGRGKFKRACLRLIHAEIDINVDNIIERFANQGHHRLEFIL